MKGDNVMMFCFNASGMLYSTLRMLHLTLPGLATLEGCRKIVQRGNWAGYEALVDVKGR